LGSTAEKIWSSRFTVSAKQVKFFAEREFEQPSEERTWELGSSRPWAIGFRDLWFGIAGEGGVDMRVTLAQPSQKKPSRNLGERTLRRQQLVARHRQGM